MKFVKFRFRRYAIPVQKRLLKPTKQALLTVPPLKSRSNNVSNARNKFEVIDDVNGTITASNV